MNAPIPVRKPDFSAIFSRSPIPAADTGSATMAEQPIVAQRTDQEHQSYPGAGLLPVIFIGYLFYRRVKNSKISKKADKTDAEDLSLAMDAAASVASGEYYRNIRNDFFGSSADGVNLQKGEVILFATRSSYYRDRVIKHYSGRSVGTTVKVGGMPIRFGASKGKPVDVRETIHESDGVFILTNKAVYFNGDKKSLRILLGKIVSYRAEEDYITIQRDAETAYPQKFTIPFKSAIVVERLLDDAVEGVVADKMQIDDNGESDVSPEMVLTMRDSH